MAKKQTQKELDLKVECALWFRNLRETNNRTFLPLFWDEHRYLVLKGGGGSGKSIFAGRKILERAITEPGHRFLVCRKVARTLRESCFKQLLGQLAEFYPDSGYKANKSDLTISFQNGSEIIFAGLDDVEKLKSIYNITGIWIEEASELLEGDFNQLDIRLRGKTREYQQIILSFNPISIQHWLKKRFFDRRDKRARVHESTYKDNRFLDAAAIRTLESFQETDEYYYQVYCLGMWGVTGKTVFNGKAVAERLTYVEKQGWRKRGFFAYTLSPDDIHISEWHWEDDENGPVILYAEPTEGRPYVVGGDTAGDGSDYFVGQVLDNITGRQVCVLRHRYDEDTYARQMYCLGRYYNDALLGIETNFSTYPVKLLALMGYPKLYVREVEDDYTGRIKQAYGFQTNRTTRPVILSELIRILRESMASINDRDTLLEMLTFVRREKDLQGEAESGAHDDCVLALAIAHYIRPQQTMEVTRPRGERVRWSQDLWDDYNKATPAEREAMIRLWGRPE